VRWSCTCYILETFEDQLRVDSHMPTSLVIQHSFVAQRHFSIGTQLKETTVFTGGAVLVADKWFRRVYRLSNVLCIRGIKLDVGSQGSIFMFEN